MSSPASPPVARFRRVRLALAICAVVLGAGIVLLAAAVGHCSAFGGRCPADPPPLWDDDVFGTAAMGAALAVGLPVWLVQPSVRRLRMAVPLALGAALVVGLIARSAASG